MNTLVILLAATAAVTTEPTIHYHGDLPDAAHAWSVHDLNRPNPPKVTAEAGKPPSDAIVLFDGTQESVAANWRSKDGSPTKWKASDGRFVCTPGSGACFTKRDFGDCQLHVEWMAPADEPGEGQGRGNSGVYMNKYELQILESFGTDPAKMTNPNYADGQAGALYGQHPPIVNPARQEGVWQSYDVLYHPAVWKNGRRVRPASITAFFNGVLIHDNWELDGPTDWVVRAQPTEFPYEGPIMLQDHGHPVPFRNIWIRPIPSRDAERAHGGAAMDPAEVSSQRIRNGAKMFSQVKDGVFDFVNAERAMEAVAYDPAGGYGAKMRTICDGLAKEVMKKDAAWLADDGHLSDVGSMQRLCKLMIASGQMPADSSLLKACNAALALRKRNPRCVFSEYIVDGARQKGIPLADAIRRVIDCGILAIDVNMTEVSAAQQMVAAGMHVESVYGVVRFLDADNGAKSGKELLAAAKLLATPRIMVLPQPFPKGADRKDCMARTIKGLKAFVADAKAADIVVTVEDFGDESSPCATIADLKQLFAGVPDLMLTLDAGNFECVGAGDDPLEALKLFRNRIVHCHVKDYRKGEAGKWCPLGKGIIPNGKIVKELMSSGYKGYFTIEETFAPDLLKAVADAEKVLSGYL